MSSATRHPTRQELACLICHAPEVAFDHVQERSTAPHLKKEPKNIAPLCPGHHLAKTNKVIKTRVVEDCPNSGGLCYEWWKGDLVFHTAVQVNERHSCLDFRGEEASVLSAAAEEEGRGGVFVAPPIPMTEPSAAALSAGEKEEGDGQIPDNARRPAVPVSSDGSGGSADSASPLTHEQRVAIANPLDDWCRRGMALVYWGERIKAITCEYAFEVGDWVNEGEAKLGEAAQQFLEVFTYWQLATWTSVARRVPPLSRDKRLPFTYHREVAALPPLGQREWLTRAREALWTRNDLRDELIKAGLIEPKQKALPATTEATDLFEIFTCPGCGYKGQRPEFRLKGKSNGDE